ncbi:hypothetical protein [Pseudomonas chlororaphis]|uniref:Uncharacterized protein n=1 Tax=Pseudomonas chlororaphis subsp. aurantiaca TaxID=86192 RepID=A0AAJ1E3T4_9PSED|nr:hypothetical protein [Pseudomonas chlororaphis]AZD25308.1 hypothetical protein C4K24_6050 [Pseudomonas chlororaphis subsp. aurantiaca]AZD51599.1 hypothetical protein C4K20_6229 [Pseudomonas chlororaphis subsp. aurantiaca]AZD76445.1 hypothetical protein C4K16_6130 [Pseudomonas chlororaphis subsp. aurantiaca]MBU4634924.1 hypothetical protein [Pseudomonas chlororaphis subsp. aurantiaca]QQX62160.1 hypothetical protein JHW28_30405 [Pseudomonas chlororaphis subsp. aurantiaca]
MFILVNEKYFTPLPGFDCYDPGCGVLAANKKEPKADSFVATNDRRRG